MIRILFVCHGNICRSPMAEFVMKDMVQKLGLEHRYEIASAATSREEIDNPVYPPARRKLAENGISCEGHRARLMTKADYEYYDLIVCMDRANLRNAQRIAGGDSENKIVLLLDHTSRKGCEVADPWYTGDFEATWRDVAEGCSGLIESLGGVKAHDVADE
ncbi:MAG: low molecular weight phosphotyrosine protein phosphatase [Clostridia bacterium]|nr:low molecular weight phosphotyrosine protein phosphatase [Clostridia bacterium]